MDGFDILKQIIVLIYIYIQMNNKGLYSTTGNERLIFLFQLW